MTFSKAGDFLSLAAQKYKMSDQVRASIVCTRAKKILAREFEEMKDEWLPKKYENGKLTIKVANSSAASALFLRTHEILEIFDAEEFPDKIKIKDILISRKDLESLEY